MMINTCNMDHWGYMVWGSHTMVANHIRKKSFI